MDFQLNVTICLVKMTVFSSEIYSGCVTRQIMLISKSHGWVASSEIDRPTSQCRLTQLPIVQVNLKIDLTLRYKFDLTVTAAAKVTIFAFTGGHQASVIVPERYAVSINTAVRLNTVKWATGAQIWKKHILLIHFPSILQWHQVILRGGDILIQFAHILRL